MHKNKDKKLDKGNKNDKENNFKFAFKWSEC